MVVANQTPARTNAIAFLRLVHRRSDLLSETLRAERSVRIGLVIPERTAKLVSITLEPELISKLAILIFEF